MARANTLYNRRDPGSPGLLPDLPPGSPIRSSGSFVLDVVNTTADRHPSTGDPFSPGYAALLGWFRTMDAVDHESADSLARLARRNPRDAAAARQRMVVLRTALCDVVSALAHDEQPAESSLDLLAREHVASLQGGGFVVRDGQLAWHAADIRDLDAPLRAVIAASVAFLSTTDPDRIRECAANACRRVFLDMSKNRSRRFCDPGTCGTATRVRRFRERTGDESDRAHDFS